MSEWTKPLSLQNCADIRGCLLSFLEHSVDEANKCTNMAELVEAKTGEVTPCPQLINTSIIIGQQEHEQQLDQGEPQNAS